MSTVRISIFSQNARGLIKDEKIEELCASLSRRKFFAGCVHETWRQRKAENLMNGDVHLIFGGGGPRRKNTTDLSMDKAGTRGVGIILSTEAHDAWKAGGFEVHRFPSARVIAVRLIVTDQRGKEVGLFLVSAYAPIGDAEQSEWEEFLDEMDGCIDKKHSNDILLIGADCNSSIGVRGASSSKVVGKFGKARVNDAGTRFRNYMSLQSLSSAATHFYRSNGKYGTWMNPLTKKMHQIDHFLIAQKDLKRVKDCGCKTSLVDSDHKSLRIDLRIALKLKRKSPKKKKIRYDMSSLEGGSKEAEEQRELFNNGVVSNYNTDSNHYDSHCEKLEAAVLKQMETLPRLKKSSHHWFKDAEGILWPLIEKRNSAMSNYMHTKKIAKPKRNDRKKRKQTLKQRRKELKAKSDDRKKRKETLKLTQKELKAAVIEAKARWILIFAKRLTGLTDGSCSSHKQGWQARRELAKGLTRTKSVKSTMMKKGDGSMCMNAKENLEVFKQHYEKLFGIVPPVEYAILELMIKRATVSNLGDMPEMPEILLALSKLNNSTPGISGVPAQLWKLLNRNDESRKLLAKTVTDFWEKEIPPKNWNKGDLKILPKKGDLSLPGNYRGIMLGEVSYKVIAQIINMRLESFHRGLNDESQCGFTNERGSRDGTFNVRMVISKRREHGLETWIVFCDQVKAFDRVSREMLWEVLKKLGIPDKLNRLLQALHKDVEVKIDIDGNEAIIISIVGVKQGDILGPTLYKLYIFAIMETWRAQIKPGGTCVFRTAEDDVIKSRTWRAQDVMGKGGALKSERKDGKDEPNFITGEGMLASGCDEFHVSDSMYADDTALVYGGREEVEKQMPSMFKHISKFGMKAHSKGLNDTKESKTVALFIAAQSSTYNDPTTFDGTSLDRIEVGNGNTIPVVVQAKYLGSIIHRDGTDKADVDARINSASQVFGSLKDCIFKEGNISKEAKVAVYKTVVMSVLLYGSESWTITKDLERKLQSFHRRCARTIFGVTMFHVEKYHIKTETVLEEINLLPINDYIARRNLAWFGKVMRMPFNRLPRKLISCWVPCPRPCSRLAVWADTVLKYMEIAGIDIDNWGTHARDEAAWCDTIGTTYKPPRYAKGLNPTAQEFIPQQLRYLQPDSIVAYTDGSCLGNRHCAVNNYIAGWGAVLLQGSSGTIENPADHGALIIRHGKIWGPVVTDPQSEHFMGAKYGSNNTGEVCAIGEVLKWVQANVFDDRTVLIRYDSKYAANVVQGTYEASSNIELARKVQQMYRQERKKRNVFFSHVKGHSGHKWNDYADKLANRGRDSSSRDK